MAGHIGRTAAEIVEQHTRPGDEIHEVGIGLQRPALAVPGQVDSDDAMGWR